MLISISICPDGSFSRQNFRGPQGPSRLCSCSLWFEPQFCVQVKQDKDQLWGTKNSKLIVRFQDSHSFLLLAKCAALGDRHCSWGPAPPLPPLPPELDTGFQSCDLSSFFLLNVGQQQAFGTKHRHRDASCISCGSALVVNRAAIAGERKFSEGGTRLSSTTGLHETWQGPQVW